MEKSQEYKEFFAAVTGCEPFPYQVRLGNESWPDILDIPTGLGKTAAVVVAWLWKRLHNDADTPRRLAYCLPMRVLVDQTTSSAEKWLEKALPFFESYGITPPQVYQLMGGEIDDGWVGLPERSALIVGTQDMLLSRALMRGYGMSRYQWPMHFALLHNDAFWVYDEVQLMGAGLSTAAQLEAFRRKMTTAKAARSLWASATLNRDWLDTVDMQPYLSGLTTCSLAPEEQELDNVHRRRSAVKRMVRSAAELNSENSKQSAKKYSETLAREILEQHVLRTTTLVVVNTVERAQAILAALEKCRTEAQIFLVHSKFRPRERQLLNKELMDSPSADGPGRIIVATQAIEAGVDITSRVLFTELAPWSSLVQRFGRCNRYGEANDDGGADIFWIDMELDGKLEIPYELEAIIDARAKLAGLKSACPEDLPKTDAKAPLHPILRAKDFSELFNTDPDLSGFDVDVSPYIRDADDLDVQIFWRDLTQGVAEQQQPGRNELCRASITQAKALSDRIKKQDQRAYTWDSLDGRWRPLSAQVKIRPGLVLMLDAGAGGYSERFGFMATVKKAVPPVTEDAFGLEYETFDGDWRSRLQHPVSLASHLIDAEDAALELCRTIGDTEQQRLLVRAARWHDVGKAHAVFQATMHGMEPENLAPQASLLAKAQSRKKHARKHFRHELASLLVWLEHNGDDDDVDLIAYLITAHHGKVRLSLRSMPEESEPIPPLGPRFARGVWEGETLPVIDITGREKVPMTRLRLDLMELGEGAMGPSWTARTQRLLKEHGPFRLAWLETLLRVADWRASAAEQEDNS